MPCEKCEKIVATFDLNEKKYKTVHQDAFFDLCHGDLLPYSDHNNGVSEGGTSYMCKVCFSFFEFTFHISMDEDEIVVEYIEAPTLVDIKAAAEFMAVEEQASIIREKINEKDTWDVFASTDLYGTNTFHYGTENEAEYFSLEINQLFGFNHPTYYEFPQVSLSLEELISDLGGDEYAKKSFFLRFKVKKVDIQVFANSSPYGPPRAMVTVNIHIPPTDIKVVDPLTKMETPLSDFSLENAKNRNHDDYLQKMRALQNELQHSEETSQRLERKKHFKNLILSQLKEKHS